MQTQSENSNIANDKNSKTFENHVDILMLGSKLIKIYLL